MTTIKSYQQASDYLGNKTNRPFAHNTRIQRYSEECIVATYHGNKVAFFYPNGNSYSSCGWKTSTTKERLNWFLPEGFYVYQKNSVWYVASRQEQKSYIFQDGLNITSDGLVSGYAEVDNTKQQIKEIKNYVDGYLAELLNGGMDSPSSGDCWHCFMNFPGNDTAHIVSHMEEKYYVPSLIILADKSYPRLSPMTKDGIARLWDKQEISAWQKSIVARDVKSVLTAFLKHSLGLAG